jgi:hypothetical protein
VGRRAGKHAAQLRPYQVVHDYQLFGKEQKSKSEVTAYIDYVPPDAHNFTLHRNNGVNMGEVIVRKILESEKEILTNQGASDVSPANYSFRLVRKDILNHQPCYVVELRPLRKDSKLLDGLIWVDASSYMTLRMEGEPARAPSWCRSAIFTSRWSSARSTACGCKPPCGQPRTFAYWASTR